MSALGRKRTFELPVLIAVADVADGNLIGNCAFRNPEVPLAVDAGRNWWRIWRYRGAKLSLEFGSVPRFELFFSERHDDLHRHR